MNIIVTGASRGIGYELVKEFAKDEKVKNVFAISRNEEKLHQLQKDCEEFGGGNKVIPIATDIGLKDFETLFKDGIEKKVGAIDIIVNNAGYLVNKPFEQLTDEDIYNIYNVNVFSVFRLVRLSLGLLVKATRPHILNIGSMGGVLGSSKFPGLSAYSSSKAALSGLTECLAEEFKDKGISVNCLALGAVQTEMLAQAFPGYKAPLSASDMAGYIKEFSIGGHLLYNGKVLPVSLSTP